MAIEQTCQPEAASPPRKECLSRLFIQVKRRGVKLFGKMDDFFGGDVILADIHLFAGLHVFVKIS